MEDKQSHNENNDNKLPPQLKQDHMEDNNNNME
jgi:hypothetical protein